MKNTKTIKDLLQIKSEEDAKHNNNKFFNIYENFSYSVSIEIGQINVVFPEFTPHDSIYHISSLVRLTNELLGEHVLDNLNSCELFILACSLYGHDWGMAVSRDEKELILTGKVPEGRFRHEFALLSDEQEELQYFASQEGLKMNNEGYFDQVDQMPLDKWRDYVRLSHAGRARARIENYFRTIDNHLGRALGIVCEGHWYKINQVYEVESSLSVAGYKINLQALTAYIRLIDLFDIANNRTPYKLWKFINPSNKFSALEWKKHEALSPVRCEAISEDGKIRRVLVHGRTNDYNVYAGLEDLHIWINKEFKENIDLLSSLGKYNPGLVDVYWKVEAEGFEPVSVQFEFERESMFNILSNEIYDGDPYVFIRELLQNSIDATHLRAALLHNKGYGKPVGTISINVVHAEDGDSTVTVTDNGIGMDERIITQYLSVAGRSYYNSEEFNKLNINLDAISKFGVGILSCFMVADRIEIKTFRDPAISGQSYLYEIDITDFRKQFHIKKRRLAQSVIGTSVTVHVKGSKWKKGTYIKENQLQITEYIKIIAGFVQEPIIVKENNTTTIVLHPSENADAYRKNSNIKDFIIHQLSYNYTKTDVFTDLTIHNVDLVFDEKTILISPDFKNKFIEGSISSFIIKGDAKLIYNSKRNRQGYSGISIGYQNGVDDTSNTSVIWKNKETENEFRGLSPSSMHSQYTRVYLKGILVPKNPIEISVATSVPPPKLLINIHKAPANLRLNMSRLKVHEDNYLLNTLIQDIYNNENQETFQLVSKETDLKLKLFALAKILAFYHTNFENLYSILPEDDWPMMEVSKKGNIVLTTINDSKDQQVTDLPAFIWSSLKVDISKGWLTEGWLDSISIEGVPSIPFKMLLTDFFNNRIGSYQDQMPVTLSATHSIMFNSYKRLLLDRWYFHGLDRANCLGFPLCSFENSSSSATFSSPRSLLHPTNQEYNFQIFNAPLESYLCALIVKVDHFDGLRVSRCLFNELHPIGIRLKLFDELNRPAGK